MDQLTSVVSNLTRWSLDGVLYHSHIRALTLTQVAYACNNRMAANTFYNSDQTYANQGITRLCGPYEPGFGYNTGSHLTYGQQHKSYSWCPEH